MTATATRLLLLGSVMVFEPVNGYRLRRELLSWRVDEWAHVNPGSIYSGLSTLARLGHLERHDLVDGGREVAVYTSTAEGREHFATMWRAAAETVDLLSPLDFHTAMSLLGLVDRRDAIDAFTGRLAALDAEIRRQADTFPDLSAVPPNVRAMADLWVGLAVTEREWLVDVIARLRRGELDLRGEEPGWAPAPDDPGWVMSRDRERYTELIRALG
jgi:DNA-binding PadR family transcriptional regulator